MPFTFDAGNASPWSPIPFQPLNFVFALKMGDLDKIYQNPQTPMSLTVTQQLGISEFQLSLMDDTGYDVEPSFFLGCQQSRQNVPLGTMQWGYTAQTERLSPVFNITSCTYSPRLMHNYFVLEVHGKMTEATPLHNSTPLHGTLKQILTDYANRHHLDLKFQVDYSPEVLLVVDSRGKTSELREKEFAKETNESDFSFVRRLVCTNAMTVNGKAGMDLIHTTIDGRDTLLVTHPEFAPSDYQWIVQHKDSTVLAWEPEVEFTPAAYLQGYAVLWYTYELLTGQEVAYAYNHKVTPKRMYDLELGALQAQTFLGDMVPLGGLERVPDKDIYTPMDTMPDPVRTSAVRIVSAPRDEMAPGFLRGLSEYIQAQNYKYEAQLTVMGDPQLEPGHIVTVVYYYPHSFRNPYSAGKAVHYTSGRYYCDKIVHTITNGSYTSQLHLRRLGLSLNPTVPEVQEG